MQQLVEFVPVVAAAAVVVFGVEGLVVVAAAAVVVASLAVDVELDRSKELNFKI